MIQFCLTPHKKSQQNVGSRKRRRSERNETGKERKKVEEAKKKKKKIAMTLYHRNKQLFGNGLYSVSQSRRIDSILSYFLLN